LRFLCVAHLAFVAFRVLRIYSSVLFHSTVFRESRVSSSRMTDLCLSVWMMTLSRRKVMTSSVVRRGIPSLPLQDGDSSLISSLEGWMIHRRRVPDDGFPAPVVTLCKRGVSLSPRITYTCRLQFLCHKSYTLHYNTIQTYNHTW